MPKNPNPILLWWWNRRANKMARCRSTEDLIRHFGQPSERSGGDGVALWHFPLGVHADRSFEIQVTVLNDVPAQAWVHAEPVEAA